MISINRSAQVVKYMCYTPVDNYVCQVVIVEWINDSFQLIEKCTNNKNWGLIVKRIWQLIINKFNCKQDQVK